MRKSSSPISLLIKLLLMAVVAAGSASCESEQFGGPSRDGAPVTETFTGTLQPSGEAFYSFKMSQPGVVSLTLVSIAGASIPADARFPLGIGSPIGAFCNAGTDASAAPGATPQYSTTKALGVYCVKITDNALLGAPAVFSLNITHPK